MNNLLGKRKQKKSGGKHSDDKTNSGIELVENESEDQIISVNDEDMLNFAMWIQINKIDPIEQEIEQYREVNHPQTEYLSQLKTSVIWLQLFSFMVAVF